MPIEFALAVYDSPEGAEIAYGRARSSQTGDTWLNEIAFVEMHHNGRIGMRGTFGDRFANLDEIGDAEARAIGLGALTGAVVGSLFGPAGFAGGLVIGGAAAGRKDAEDDVPSSGELVEELRRDLKPGTSALILLAETEHVDEMVSTLNLESDHVIRRELTEEEVKTLEDSIAYVPVAKPGEFT